MIGFYYYFIWQIWHFSFEDRNGLGRWLLFSKDTCIDYGFDFLKFFVFIIWDQFELFSVFFFILMDSKSRHDTLDQAKSGIEKTADKIYIFSDAPLSSREPYCLIAR